MAPDTVDAVDVVDVVDGLAGTDQSGDAKVRNKYLLLQAHKVSMLFLLLSSLALCIFAAVCLSAF